MITKDTYGQIVVMFSMAVLLFLLICSFVLSFQKIDLLYAICLAVFMFKLIRMK